MSLVIGIVFFLTGFAAGCLAFVWAAGRILHYLEKNL